ncbi:universal stress protein [Nocardioides pyridinolyticus]
MTSRDIVVGLDTHDTWQDAVDWAADQAARENRALTLVHVADSAEELWHDASGHERRIGVVQIQTAGELVLDRARTRVAERTPGVPVHVVLRGGGVRDGLHAVAQGAHLLVVGSRRHRTLWSRLAGTRGAAVTRRPPCPAVVVHAVHPGEVRRGVLVGIDDTEHAAAALRFAFRQASLTGRPLTVVHVAPEAVYGAPTDEDDQQLSVAEAVAGLREQFPDVPVRTTVERGDPAAVLLGCGRRMNLIVLLGAQHRRPVVEVLLGSVVGPVVDRATCPVAVVPDEALAAGSA